MKMKKRVKIISELVMYYGNYSIELVVDVSYVDLMGNINDTSHSEKLPLSLILSFISKEMQDSFIEAAIDNVYSILYKKIENSIANDDMIFDVSSRFICPPYTYSIENQQKFMNIDPALALPKDTTVIDVDLKEVLCPQLIALPLFMQTFPF